MVNAIRNQKWMPSGTSTGWQLPSGFSFQQLIPVSHHNQRSYLLFFFPMSFSLPSISLYVWCEQSLAYHLPKTKSVWNCSTFFSLQLRGRTAWSFQLRSHMFGSQIAVSILDVCSAVTPSFGYVSAVWGDSGSFKIKSVWQSSHVGAATCCVVHNLLWGILYQKR